MWCFYLMPALYGNMKQCLKLNEIFFVVLIQYDANGKWKSAIEVKITLSIFLDTENFPAITLSGKNLQL